MAMMSESRSYPVGAFILTLIGGIIILLAGIVTATFYAIFGAAVGSLLPGLGALLIGLAVVSLLFGLIIIFGAIQMRAKPQSAKMWGILVIVLAFLSFVGGGGYVIGFLLALIGGILALVWRPPAMAQPAWGQPGAPAMPGAPGWNAPPPAAAPAAGSRVCASCGSSNAAGAQFCAKCGAPMASP